MAKYEIPGLFLEISWGYYQAKLFLMKEKFLYFVCFFGTEWADVMCVGTRTAL